jgi:hypothetical protein
VQSARDETVCCFDSGQSLGPYEPYLSQRGVHVFGQKAARLSSVSALRASNDFVDDSNPDLAVGAIAFLRCAPQWVRSAD